MIKSSLFRGHFYMIHQLINFQLSILPNFSFRNETVLIALCANERNVVRVDIRDFCLFFKNNILLIKPLTCSPFSLHTATGLRGLKKSVGFFTGIFFFHNLCLPDDFTEWSHSCIVGAPTAPTAPLRFPLCFRFVRVRRLQAFTRDTTE